MKKNTLTVVLLLFVIVSLVLTACSSSTTTPEDTSAKTPDETTESNVVANPTNFEEWNPKERYDLSEPANLTVYFAGDAQIDQQKVDEAFNQLMSELINTTVTINYLTWADTYTKYPLTLASGETVDIAFGAAWLDYGGLSLKGAFTPIEDYIDE